MTELSWGNFFSLPGNFFFDTSSLSQFSLPHWALPLWTFSRKKIARSNPVVHISANRSALRKCGDPPSLAVLRPSIVCGLRLLHREDLDLWCTGAKSIFVTKNESPDAPYLILYSVLYHHVSFVSLLVSLKIGSGRNSCFARGCKNYSRWVVPSSGSEFIWFHQQKIGQSADQPCQSTDLKIPCRSSSFFIHFPMVSLLFFYHGGKWWKATMDVDHFPRVKPLPLSGLVL